MGVRKARDGQIVRFSVECAAGAFVAYGQVVCKPQDSRHYAIEYLAPVPGYRINQAAAYLLSNGDRLVINCVDPRDISHISEREDVLGMLQSSTKLYNQGVTERLDVTDDRKLTHAIDYMRAYPMLTHDIQYRVSNPITSLEGSNTVTVGRRGMDRADGSRTRIRPCIGRRWLNPAPQHDAAIPASV